MSSITTKLYPQIIQLCSQKQAKEFDDLVRDLSTWQDELYSALSIVKFIHEIDVQSPKRANSYAMIHDEALRTCHANFDSINYEKNFGILLFCLFEAFPDVLKLYENRFELDAKDLSSAISNLTERFYNVEQEYKSHVSDMLRSSAVAEELSGDILTYNHDIDSTSNSTEERINVVLEDLGRCIHNIELPAGYQASVHPFGSSITGLSSVISDIDISLCIYDSTRPVALKTTIGNVLDSEIEFVQQLQVAQHDPSVAIAQQWLQKLVEVIDADAFTIKETLTLARIPIVKLKHVDTDIELDIGVGNVLGIANSILISSYIDCDPRVRPLILAIKHWTKRRVCCGGNNSLLTSYAWVCLVINFLQCGVQPPVLPSLQHPTTGFTKYSNNDTLGELFVKFFMFYSVYSDRFFDIYTHCASIRFGSVIEKAPMPNDESTHYKTRSDIETIDTALSIVAKCTEKRSRGRMCIEDPFEVHDLGKVLREKNAQIHILTEMRRVVDIVLNQSSYPDGLWAVITEETTKPCDWKIRCLLCQNPGHFISSCPLAFCNRCKSRGHAIERCPKSRCTNCKELGHLVLVCTSLRCKNCGGRHTLSRCLTRACSTCGEIGHKTAQCPLATCSFCNKLGHQIASCAERKAALKEQEKVEMESRQTSSNKKDAPNRKSQNNIVAEVKQYLPIARAEAQAEVNATEEAETKTSSNKNRRSRASRKSNGENREPKAAQRIEGNQVNTAKNASNNIASATTTTTTTNTSEIATTNTATPSTSTTSATTTTTTNSGRSNKYHVPNNGSKNDDNHGQKQDKKNKDNKPPKRNNENWRKKESAGGDEAREIVIEITNTDRAGNASKPNHRQRKHSAKGNNADKAENNV